MKRKIPGYRKSIRKAAASMVKNLENSFSEKWAEEADSTLNYGDHEDAVDDDDDFCDY